MSRATGNRLVIRSKEHAIDLSKGVASEVALLAVQGGSEPIQVEAVPSRCYIPIHDMWFITKETLCR